MTKNQQVRLNAIVTALDDVVETNTKWKKHLSPEDVAVVDALNNHLEAMRNVVRNVVDEA